MHLTGSCIKELKFEKKNKVVIGLPEENGLPKENWKSKEKKN